MPRDLTHAVLEGLDEAKSAGGLVIMKKKKKEDGEQEKGGFKLPVGPSKLGLDRCILLLLWQSLKLLFLGWQQSRRKRGGIRS